LARAFRAP